MIFILFLFGQIVLKAADAPVVNIQTAPCSIVPGQSDTIAFSITIKAGFHIQGTQLPDENMIPTQLEFDKDSLILLGDPILPQPHLFKMAGMPAEIPVLDSSFSIYIPFKISKFFKSGERIIKGSLFYQACDSVRCLFPKREPIELTFRIKNK